MINRVLFLILLSLPLSSLASEKVVKKGNLESRRIEHVQFKNGKIYPLLGVTNHPFVIEFPDNQTILEVAGGGIGGWDVQRKGSRLFIRAFEEAELATLIVVSDVHTYIFDLVPGKPDRENLRKRRSQFVIESYPKADIPTNVQAIKSTVPAIESTSLLIPKQAINITPAVQVEAVKLDSVEENIAGVVASIPISKSISVKSSDIVNPSAPAANSRYNATVTSPTEATAKKSVYNRKYTMQVVKEEVVIRPKEVFDDGVFTWFLFPENHSVPVIYKSVPDTQEESVVNFHMDGEYVVAHSTAALWNLRLGASLVGVFNGSYNTASTSAKPK